jgi:hypothetical protein
MTVMNQWTNRSANTPNYIQIAIRCPQSAPEPHAVHSLCYTALSTILLQLQQVLWLTVEEFFIEKILSLRA